VSYSNPSSLLFIGVGKLREDTPSTSEWAQEPTRSHHVEGGHWQPKGRVGQPPMGPTPLVLPCGGCQVGPQVGSKCPHGLKAIWTRLWAIE
jgi:hypothetical protein